MDLNKILKEMYQNIDSPVFSDHERIYIDNMYKKIVYAGRPPEGTDSKTVKRLYQVYISRTAK